MRFCQQDCSRNLIFDIGRSILKAPEARHEWGLSQGPIEQIVGILYYLLLVIKNSFEIIHISLSFKFSSVYIKNIDLKPVRIEESR